MKKTIILCLIQFLLFKSVLAQLCTGSLGDPVVNITFGNDDTPNGPLKHGVTNLSFTGGCPNDGQYTITNLSFGCFNNTWFLLVGDHTSDKGGRFMLINASFEPSDFYVDTVNGLCGNTVYELAAWASNVLKPTSCGGAGIKPNLTFKIETTTGKILQQFNSGDISSGNERTWYQYGTFFKTPTGVESVVMRITNNSKGGCGNDLMLDDITFRPCGPKVSASAINDTTGYINICENDTKIIPFTANYSTVFIDPVLQWQVSKDTGKSWVDIVGEQKITYNRKPTSAGLFMYRVAIAERSNFASVICRIVSNVTAITVNAFPNGPTFSNIIGCTNNEARVNALQGSDYTYLWKGPNGFTSTLPYVLIPLVKYSDSGLYIVTESLLGCFRIDSSNLKVFQNAKAVINPIVSICEGTNVILRASGGIGFWWTPSTGLSNSNTANPTASPIDTINYKVVVTNQYGCKDSAFTTVNVWKKPIVSAGADYRIFEGESVILNGKVTGTSISILWTPNLYIQNVNSLTPTVSPIDNTNYKITGTSDLGCGTTMDEVSVKVYKSVKAPNAFSPNGDGINDTWVISGLETYPDANLKVFSRSGQIVFQTRAIEKIWDGNFNGKPLPIGIYYYIIDLNIGTPIISGWVIIIR